MFDNGTIVNRLNLIYGESKMTQEKFAKICNVSGSAMKNYLKGERMLPLENVIALCNHFSVSADWLLGLSDVRQPSADLRGVCNFTGLSEQAINKITDTELNHPMSKTLSRMIESERFSNFITTYQIFLTFLNRLKVEDLEKMADYEIQEDRVILGRNEAVFHYKEQVCSAMQNLCEENYRDHVQELIQDVQGPFSLSMEPFNIKLQRGDDIKD